MDRATVRQKKRYIGADVLEDHNPVGVVLVNEANRFSASGPVTSVSSGSGSVM